MYVTTLTHVNTKGSPWIHSRLICTLLMHAVHTHTHSYFPLLFMLALTLYLIILLIWAWIYGFIYQTHCFPSLQLLICFSFLVKRERGSSCGRRLMCYSRQGQRLVTLKHTNQWKDSKIQTHWHIFITGYWHVPLFVVSIEKLIRFSVFQCKFMVRNSASDVPICGKKKLWKMRQEKSEFLMTFQHVLQ